MDIMLCYSINDRDLSERYANLIHDNNISHITNISYYLNYNTLNSRCMTVNIN